MASIIEAFKQIGSSEMTNNNSDKLTAILLWNANRIKKIVVDLALNSTFIREMYNLDLIDEQLHDKLSAAFGLYRQWLWLETIFGAELYKQDLSNTNLISQVTTEIIDRELDSVYYFDIDQYMNIVYDDFVADIRQAYNLYHQDPDSPAGPDIINTSIEKYFYILLLNPTIYVKDGVYIDKWHHETIIDVNKIGPSSLSIPVPTAVSIGSTVRGKRRGLFY
jgi:hypothetical protein